MKYEEALIVNIKNKVKEFLNERRFTKYEDIDAVFTDPTRRAYYSTVEDQKGEKFFIKIRALDLDFDKRSFEKQKVIGTILRNNPELVLNTFTPKLIESSNNEVDFLLYEYIEGDNLGSRDGYAISKLTNRDVVEVLAILKAMFDFPVNLLPESFEKRGKKYYQDFLLYANPAKQIDEKLGIDWEVFDKSTTYLTHGDFKPNNFLRTKNGLIVLDFEQASISNIYADFIRIWAAEIRNLSFKDKLMEAFIREFKLNERDKLFHDMKLIHNIFERNYVKYKFTNVKDEFLALREEEVEKSI